MTVAGRFGFDQKSGISALALQRDIGLKSYKTVWAMLHKLRRAMVRSDRELLKGTVEVDETDWGGSENGGAIGRLIFTKSLIVVAAEQDGRGIGRTRLARIADTSRSILHCFIRQNIEIGSTILTRWRGAVQVFYPAERVSARTHS